MLFFLSALAAPPPCTASQAPGPYAGKQCIVSGDRSVCELGVNGSMVCDLRLEQDSCVINPLSDGFRVWSVDWDGNSVSTFGECVKATAPVNPTYPNDYILFCCNEDDLAALTDVQLLGSDGLDVLSFRYQIPNGPLHYLQNDVQANGGTVPPVQVDSGVVAPGCALGVVGR